MNEPQSPPFSSPHVAVNLQVKVLALEQARLSYMARVGRASRLLGCHPQYANLWMCVR